MPRLRGVPRDEVVDPLIKATYAHLFGDRDPIAHPGTEMGTRGDWWTVLAQAPHILEHFILCSRMYMGEKMSLSPTLRELAQTRVGWLTGCQFVYSQHCKMARLAGLSEREIAAIDCWEVADCFDEAQRTVLVYTDYLVDQRGRVPEAVMERLKTHLSEPAIVELTYVACCYVGYSLLTKALRLEFDDRDDVVVEVAAPETYAGSDFLGGRR